MKPQIDYVDGSNADSRRNSLATRPVRFLNFRLSLARDVRGMPAPTDVEGVRRLCGMAQYMARFLPNLAETLEPMRALTQKDTPFAGLV